MAEQPAQPQQTRLCTRCKEPIAASFPHCTSPTCSWCRDCGERVRSSRKP